MRLTIKSLAVAVFAAVGATAPASAEPGERLFEMIDACRDDYYRLCPGVPPGGGRILSCLADNKHDLNPVCYKAFTVAAAVKACSADYHTFCSHVPPGEDRAVRCLGDYAEEVSEPCSRALTAALSLHKHEYSSGRTYRDPGYSRYDEPKEHGYKADPRYGYDVEPRRHGYHHEKPAPYSRYDEEDLEPDTLK
ncbi:MAG: cysteine rich repeat-containing protein [Hyphomicrobiales bacterium]|nr:cysteine rich repeat-containing protein [Hyphomicrobiales bacterium]